MTARFCWLARFSYPDEKGKKMNTKRAWTAIGLLAVFGATSVVPGVVFAQSSKAANRQKNKNTWRNAAGAAAAIAGYGLIKGNSTATVLGAAGAAYSANRYEKDRKSQDAAKRARASYHRTGNYTHNGRKYYTYQGHHYYMDVNTGQRHLID